MCGDENSIVISRELHAANLEERALSPDVCPTVNCGAFPVCERELYVDCANRRNPQEGTPTRSLEVVPVAVPIEKSGERIIDLELFW